jgi:GNAT superfamily N-acetyltransferase
MKRRHVRFGEGLIAACAAAELREISDVINDGASAYRGVIAADRWKDPYMPLDELRAEIDAGVVFFGYRENRKLDGVMGLQPLSDVALIRHAYTRSAAQGRGIGSTLLEHLRRQTDLPLLVGTWKAADWAVRFYERRGFAQVGDAERTYLLNRYWSVPDRQIDESVVLRVVPRT